MGRPRAGRQRTASAPIPVMSETQSCYLVRPNSTQRNSNSPAQTHGLGDPPASRVQGLGANVLYASPDVRARGQAGQTARVSCLRGGEGRGEAPASASRDGGARRGEATLPTLERRTQAARRSSRKHESSNPREPSIERSATQQAIASSTVAQAVVSGLAHARGRGGLVNAQGTWDWLWPCVGKVRAFRKLVAAVLGGR